MMLAACGLALACALSAPAHATQHLVSPGDDWEKLEQKVKPGDEIILMGDRPHRGAAFASLLGEPDRRITIRGVDPNKPAQIAADRGGIRVSRAANLIIENLSITGGTICGIGLTGDPTKQAVDNAGRPGGITIRNVSISKIGPGVGRHAIIISGLSDVQIENCTIDGWGGSGIEIIGGQDISISRCKLTGRDEYEQKHGIRVRAGSNRVQIDNCRFENAGERVISLGGVSKLEDFKPPIPEKPAQGKAPFEAASVRVERCVIIGGTTAIAFVNADDCVARNNTIINPKRCALSLTNEQKDARFSPGQANIFGLNIIVWEPGKLPRRAEIGPKTASDKFVLEENVWWSGENNEQLARMGPLPGKNPRTQITDMNPELNSETMKTWKPELSGFGA